MRLFLLGSLTSIALFLCGCASVPPCTMYTQPGSSNRVTSLVEPYSGHTQVITVTDQTALNAQSVDLFRRGFIPVGESKFRAHEKLLSANAEDIVSDQAAQNGADIVLLQRTTAPKLLTSALLRPENCHAIFFRRAAPPALGVVVSDASPDWRDHHHYSRAVMVNNVMDGTPASRAGLKRGDVIVKLDDKAVGLSQDFNPLVHSFAGKICKLTYYRGEEMKEVLTQMNAASFNESRELAGS